jgi:2-methylisocitrate lyase-like PEP mutase family enzyme
MAPTQADKARAFVRLHEGPRAFIIPNPPDIGTARILAGLGFEALATTSAGMAFALGRRDGQVTRDEAMAHVRGIAEATPLPVSGDLENGYGDAPETVAETIRLAAAAGLVGGSIEDSTRDPTRPIYDHGQAVERVAAAVEAARGLPFPFTLTARAENFLYGRTDLADTMERLRAFEAAGADVLYAPGLRDLGQIREVCRAVTKPVNVLAGMPGASFSVEALSAAGVRRISLGGSLARAALGAFLAAAREMKEQGTFTFVNGAVSTKELNSFFSGQGQ